MRKSCGRKLAAAVGQKHKQQIFMGRRRRHMYTERKCMYCDQMIIWV